MPHSQRCRHTADFQNLSQFFEHSSLVLQLFVRYRLILLRLFTIFCSELTAVAFQDRLLSFSYGVITVSSIVPESSWVLESSNNASTLYGVQPRGVMLPTEQGVLFLSNSRNEHRIRVFLTSATSPSDLSTSRRPFDAEKSQLGIVVLYR